jgi:hypothetical protein
MIKSDEHAKKIIKKYQDGYDTLSARKFKKMKKLLKERNHQDEAIILRYIQNFSKMLERYESLNTKVGDITYTMEDMNQQILGEIETIILAVDSFSDTGNLKRILEFLESDL